MPSIEALSQELSCAIAVQRAEQFRRAVNEYFYTGGRKKRPNKSVEDLTTLLWMFMNSAAENRGLSSEEIRHVKSMCKKITTAIIKSPTVVDMIQICRDHMMAKRRQLAEHNATRRALTAIYHLTDQCAPSMSPSMALNSVFAHVISGNILYDLHQRTDAKDIAFIDTADMLLSLGYEGITTSCS